MKQTYVYQCEIKLTVCSISVSFFTYSSHLLKKEHIEINWDPKSDMKLKSVNFFHFKIYTYFMKSCMFSWLISSTDLPTCLFLVSCEDLFQFFFFLSNLYNKTKWNSLTVTAGWGVSCTGWKLFLTPVEFLICGGGAATVRTEVALLILISRITGPPWEEGEGKGLNVLTGGGWSGIGILFDLSAGIWGVLYPKTWLWLLLFLSP